MTSRFIPNSFTNPNAFVDEILPLIAPCNPNEAVILWYMIRQILGWQGESEQHGKPISLTEFCEGTGKYHAGTGLSRGAATRALKGLSEFRIVRKVGYKQNMGTIWDLCYGEQIDIEGLKARLEDKKNKNKKRISNAREALDDAANEENPEMAVCGTDEQDLAVCGTDYQQSVGQTVINTLSKDTNIMCDAQTDVSIPESKTESESKPEAKATPHVFYATYYQRGDEKRRTWFDAVMLRILNLDPYKDVNAKTNAWRVGKILKAIQPIYDEYQFAPTLLKNFMEWYEKECPGTTLLDDKKVATWLLKYLQRDDASTTQIVVDASTPHKRIKIGTRHDE